MCCGRPMRYLRMTPGYTTSGSADSGNPRIRNAPSIAGCTPALNGSTWTFTCGSLAISVMWSSCLRIALAPPTTRRMTASFSTTQYSGGSSPVSSSWLRVRGAGY